METPPEATIEALAAALPQELLRCFPGKQTVQIDMKPHEALAVIGAIQLGLRHPGNQGACNEIATAFIRRLQHSVFHVSPLFQQVIEMGFNPQYDMNAPQQQQGFSEIVDAKDPKDAPPES